MKNIFNLAAAVLLLVSAASCREEHEYKNSLALPDCLYMLEGVSADLYSESFVQRWDPYDFHVRYSGSCGLMENRRDGKVHFSSLSKLFMLRKGDEVVVEGSGKHTKFEVLD